MLAEYWTFHKENSWAVGSNLNLLFCGWVSQGSKEGTKECQLQESVYASCYLLTDKDIVIGDNTRKALQELSLDHQRNTALGICYSLVLHSGIRNRRCHWVTNFYDNLGVLNPAKRKKDSTVSSIQSLTSTLQPRVNETEVVDK